jgi:diguanylate cyclase (GGDEF)-like protein
MILTKAEYFRNSILKHISREILFEYIPRKDILKYSYKKSDKTMNGKIQGYINDKNYVKAIHPESQVFFIEMLKDACDSNTRVEFETLTNICGSGYRWYSMTLQSKTSLRGKVQKVLGRAWDIHKFITERDLAVERAATDMMTGIYNKVTLAEKIEARLKVDGGEKCAMLMIDLDDFKYVNDHYGHAVGDEVIRNVASLLQRTFDADDLIGRFGGDEFVVFMQNVSTETVQRKVEQFRRILADERDDAFILTCSIGVLILHEAEISLDTLFQKVDTAMYKIKHNGKNGYHVWTSDEYH